MVDVGAGTGSYEPRDRRVLAVEASLAMIRQRPADAPRAIQAVAEALPLASRSFDAALAVLTVHHWTDRAGGLAELRRVARRVVAFTWDPAATERFWLTTDYFTEILALDVPRFVPIAVLAALLGGADVRPVPVPWDCQDGFLGAYWRRPAAYLDPAVRQGMSGFAQLEGSLVERGIARLAADLRSGAWEARFGALGGLAELDLGYRLVVGGGGA